MIHESGSNLSQYTIAYSLFTEDGVFRFTTYTVNKNHHETNTSLSTLATIKYCVFKKGSNHSLLLCIHPGNQNFHYNIIIQDCKFEKFTGYTKQNIALKVSYGESMKKFTFCPNIQVKVKSTIFRNIRGRVAEYVLPTTIYRQNLLKPCRLILIDNCTHEYNTFSSKDAIVKITPVNAKQGPTWEYPNGINNNGVNLEQVKILNTAFRTNHPGSFQVHSIYITLENCIFHKSTHTALSIVYSVVVMKGFNTISCNIGRKGGGIHLLESIMHFSSNSITIIKQNEADFGGGILESLSMSKDVDQRNDCAL